MPNAYENTSGITLLYGDTGATDPATALAGIDAINGLPTNEVDEFEITRVDQMDGANHDWFKQFAPDHIDPGELDLSLGFDGTNYETCQTMIRTLKKWMIKFPSGAKLVFDGFIKTLGPQAQDRDEVVFQIVVRVSGKPVFTKAPAPAE